MVNNRKKVQRRIIILVVLMLMGILVVTFRYGWLQLVQGSELALYNLHAARLSTEMGANWQSAL